MTRMVMMSNMRRRKTGGTGVGRDGGRIPTDNWLGQKSEVGGDCRGHEKRTRGTMKMRARIARERE
eukprot:7179541-Pyramimonas_sp.AAC.1